VLQITHVTRNLLLPSSEQKRKESIVGDTYFRHTQKVVRITDSGDLQKLNVLARLGHIHDLKNPMSVN
jgi:hypothetical protein